MSSNQFVKLCAEKSNVVFNFIPHDSGRADFITHDVIATDRKIIYGYTTQSRKTPKDEFRLKEEFFLALDSQHLRYSAFRYDANENIGEETSHILYFDEKGDVCHYEIETYNAHAENKYSKRWTDNAETISACFASIHMPETILAKDDFSERLFGARAKEVLEFIHHGCDLTALHNKFKFEPVTIKSIDENVLEEPVQQQEKLRIA